MIVLSGLVGKLATVQVARTCQWPESNAVLVPGDAARRGGLDGDVSHDSVQGQEGFTDRGARSTLH